MVKKYPHDYCTQDSARMLHKSDKGSTHASYMKHIDAQFMSIVCCSKITKILPTPCLPIEGRAGAGAVWQGAHLFSGALRFLNNFSQKPADKTPQGSQQLLKINEIYKATQDEAMISRFIKQHFCLHRNSAQK